MFRKDKVRPRNRCIQSDLTTVDPGDGQAKPFAADKSGELRLPECRISSLVTPASSIK